MTFGSWTARHGFVFDFRQQFPQYLDLTRNKVLASKGVEDAVQFQYNG